MPAILLQNMRAVEGDDGPGAVGHLAMDSSNGLSVAMGFVLLGIATPNRVCDALSRAKQKGAEHHAPRL
jgi:hypothetical protein